MSNEKEETLSPIFYEQVLIKFLFTSVEIREKILPYLTEAVFDDKLNMNIVSKILLFQSKYNKFPTFQEMKLYISDEDTFDRLVEIINLDLTEYTHEFIIEQIEEWFKGKKIHEVNLEISMNLNEGDFPKIMDCVDMLRESCTFSFNTTIGLDFFESEEELYNFLHNKDRVISSGLKSLDRCIDGGFHEKSLTLFMAECVDENTKVKIRIRKKWSFYMSDTWVEKEVSIKDIKKLLEEYNVQVDSPDGWVDVTHYVEKGRKRAWKLLIDDKELLSSGKHLYETNFGWKHAKFLDHRIHRILCNDGKFHSFDINKTDKFINVVDIRVNHPNHRYYTNGISSHNTNLGKTLVMSSLATNNILNNKNVLYITCEMSKHKISERTMANMFNLEMNDLKNLDKKEFHSYFEQVKKIVKSKFFIEEYPTKSINANHIRNLVKELKTKKKFIPDIIYIDYIEIMNPIHRYKGDGSYSEIKRISEEVRAVAVELGIPIVSAVQTNRGGIGSAQIDLTDISQSIGTAATADIIIGITQTEELREKCLFSWMILKNRYGINKKGFRVCVDYYKMRIWETDQENGSEVKDYSKNPKSVNEKNNEFKSDIDDTISLIDDFNINNKNKMLDKLGDINI